MTEESVIDLLKTIFDPEIPVNIYDLGLIYSIEIEHRTIRITMTLTTASCPAAAFIPEEIKTLLLAKDEVDDVEVSVVYQPKWTKEKMSDDAQSILGF